MSSTKEKRDVLQGTLALMVLKTLDVLGPLHGYAIARRIEQTSGDLLSVNYGTLYPSLLKLEQEGFKSLANIADFDEIYAPTVYLFRKATVAANPKLPELLMKCQSSSLVCGPR